MNTVPKNKSEKRHIIADLSWLLGTSGNDNPLLHTRVKSVQVGNTLNLTTTLGFMLEIAVQETPW